MATKRAFGVLVVIGWATVAVAAADCPRLDGRWGYGVVSAVAVEGSLAFYGEDDELVVVDIGDPRHPAELARLDVGRDGWPWRRLLVAGGYLYAGRWSGDVVVVRVANPRHPTVVARVALPAYLGGGALAKLGDLLYVASDFQLTVLDVAMPWQPAVVAVRSIRGLDIAIAGDSAYVAGADFGDGANRLAILDLTDPRAPRLVEQLTPAELWPDPASPDAAPPGSLRAVAVSGGLLYLTAETGLLVADLTDPTRPVGLGSCPLPNGWILEHIAVDTAAGLAYVARHWRGLEVVDVHDAAAPRLLASWSPPGDYNWLYDAAGDQSRLLVATQSDGLQLLDLADPAAPLAIGNPVRPRFVHAVALAGDVVVALDSWQSVRALVASDDGVLHEAGAVSFQNRLEDLATVTPVAVAAIGGGRLEMIDVGTPSTPRIRRSLQLSGDVLAAAGTLLATSVGDGGPADLRLVDVTDSFAPQVVAELALADADGTPVSYVSALLVTGDTVLAVGETEPQVCNFFDEWWEGEYVLLALDVSEPANPALLGSVNLGCEWVSSVAVADGWAWAVHPGVHGSRLDTVDLSDPARPELVDSRYGVVPADSVSLTVAGGLALVPVNDTDRGPSILALDLVDPRHLQRLGSVTLQGGALDVATDGDHVVVAAGFSGVAAIDLDRCRAWQPPPTTPVLAPGVAGSAE